MRFGSVNPAKAEFGARDVVTSEWRGRDPREWRGSKQQRKKEIGQGLKNLCKSCEGHGDLTYDCPEGTMLKVNLSRLGKNAATASFIPVPADAHIHTLTHTHTHIYTRTHSFTHTNTHIHILAVPVLRHLFVISVTWPWLNVARAAAYRHFAC